MGYDMQSKMFPDEAGYFRFSIWGMAKLRPIIVAGDPELESEIFRFCSNDGYVVGEKLGKRIAHALRAFLVERRAGDAITPLQAPHEKMFSQMFGLDIEDSVLDEETIRDVREFADYNETKAPYEVW